MRVALDSQILRKVTLRIAPVLAVTYVVAYLDRVNLGFAATTMNSALGISGTTFGIAGGMFFLGYITSQVPSNRMLLRFGARRWLSFIVLCWGAVSAGMALVKDGTTLIVMRFLLGVAEAGFFPGAVLYLTLWVPTDYRGRVLSAFLFAIPVANIVGSPLSAIILGHLDGYFGFAGWQWVFMLEAAPAILGGGLLAFLLTDRPEYCRWLTDQERLRLTQMIASDRSVKMISPKQAGSYATVAYFALTYFLISTASNGMGLWLPLIISENVTDLSLTGWLNALPYALAAAALLAWGSYTDKRRAAPSTVWLPTLTAAIFFTASALAPSFAVAFPCLVFAIIALMTSLSAYWTHVTVAHKTVFDASAIALTNAMGNLGGLFGPIVIGWARDMTQNFQSGQAVIASALFLATLLLGLKRTL